MADPKDFNSENQYTWCPGCGNFMIHMVLKKVLAAEDYNPRDVLACFDIGCCGNASDKIFVNSFHGLHGRVIPVVAGAHLANRTLKTVAFGGDGGTLGEGFNHLIHAIRSNYDIMFVMHNNANFGLTTGQASPSTKQDIPMNSTPYGVPEDTLNAMKIVLSANPTFAARTYSGNIDHMADIFKQALDHKGFSFVEVLQYCPTYYGDYASPVWFNEHTYDLKTVNHNSSDMKKALELADDITDKIGLGVFYQDEKSVPFYDRLENRKGKNTELIDEVESVDISEFLKGLV
jgi:2-oxoglutarate ferredoxin oxidoreductase subunit beta